MESNCHTIIVGEKFFHRLPSFLEILEPFKIASKYTERPHFIPVWETAGYHTRQSCPVFPIKL